MKKILYIILFFAFGKVQAQQYGPLPADTEAPSVEISADESRIVGYHKGVLAIWDGQTGSLIKQVDLSGSKDIVNGNCYVYAVSPNASQIAIASASTVYLFDGEGNKSPFPQQYLKTSIVFLGFNYKGYYIGAKNEGKKYSYIAHDPANQQVEKLFTANKEKAYSMLSSDGKALLVEDDNELKSYHFPTKKYSEPLKINDGWAIPHQPDGWIRIPNRKRGKLKEQIFYNYETGKIIEEKTDNNSQLEYLSTEKNICFKFWSQGNETVLRTSSNYQWRIVNEKYDGDIICAKIIKSDRNNNCADVFTITLQQDPKEALKKLNAEKEAKKEAEKAKKEAEKARKEAKYAAQRTAYRQFAINFVQLPDSYTLDYDNIVAKDITRLQGTKILFPYISSGNIYAIGRINRCGENGEGGTFLIMMRDRTNNMDQSTFGIISTDGYGNNLDYKQITQTQKAMGRLTVEGHFSLIISGDTYTVHASKKYSNGHVAEETIKGGCL